MAFDEPAFSLTPKQEEIAALLAGPAKHSLIYGGSRSGKTFALCWAIAQRAIKAPGSRHAIFRRHGVAVKQSIGKDTFPKVMALAFPGVAFKWYEQDGYFTVGDGSEVWLAGLDDKERVDKVLGKEFATLYFNEASEIPYASYIVAQTRLAQKVARFDGQTLPLRSFVDLNPTARQHWTYRLYVDGVEPEGETPVDPDNYVVATANPVDNAANLTPDYLESLRMLPERARKRFWDGEYTGDAEDALWRRSMFKRHNQAKPLPDFIRVVVAIDPATTAHAGSNETGIICAAADANGNGYLLADDSGVFPPQGWAQRGISAYEQFNADRIVAEKNQGGDMVEAVIRAQQKDVPITLVHASRGKVTRAEPVAALYERGKVYHVGEFPQLEDQLCQITVGFDREAAGYSPDRMDALVWAFSALFPQMTRKATAGKPIVRKVGTLA